MVERAVSGLVLRKGCQAMVTCLHHFIALSCHCSESPKIQAGGTEQEDERKKFLDLYNICACIHIKKPPQTEIPS